jgi:hypothetical protein
MHEEIPSLLLKKMLARSAPGSNGGDLNTQLLDFTKVKN